MHLNMGSNEARALSHISSLSHLYAVSRQIQLWKRAPGCIRPRQWQRGIFLGTQFCKWHKLPVTCVTLTIQRTHVPCAEVTTQSALFTPAEEINFRALIDCWWGAKQDEKTGERHNANHLRLYVCEDLSFSNESDCTDSCRLLRKLQTGVGWSLNRYTCRLLS